MPLTRNQRAIVRQYLTKWILNAAKGLLEDTNLVDEDDDLETLRKDLDVYLDEHAYSPFLCDLVDNKKYPLILRFRVENGVVVFPVQSDIENLAIEVSGNHDNIYADDGFKAGEGDVVLTYSHCYGGWVLGKVPD